MNKLNRPLSEVSPLFRSPEDPGEAQKIDAALIQHFERLFTRLGEDAEKVDLSISIKANSGWQAGPEYMFREIARVSGEGTAIIGGFGGIRTLEYLDVDPEVSSVDLSRSIEDPDWDTVEVES